MDVWKLVIVECLELIVLFKVLALAVGVVAALSGVCN